MRVRAVRSTLIWFAAVFAFSSAAQAAPQFADPVDDVVAVFDAIDSRLALMEDVAAWKWREQRPVADPEREARVIDAAVTQAATFGLDAAATRELLTLQIGWARDIQSRYFENWRRDGFPEGKVVRSLDTELRPQLDVIGARLLRSIYLAMPWMEQHAEHVRVMPIRQRIAGRLVEPNIDATLQAALLAFKPVAGQLQAIRNAKVLRIGTTGDYAPFSFEARGELNGIDIQLATSLAQQLGAEARFVHTTWPTLLRDLQQGRFDIAASGISITPERAAVASFSVAYHRDGKTPIARCSQRERFASVRAIDQPTVRVIVNPGGTNERFARERLRRAQLRIHGDNKTIFEEIVAGRADVMVTDAIEADLQTRKHPELCRTTDELFTQADKAMLMPLRTDLAAIAGAWLREEIERGAVRAALQSSMSSATSR